MMRTVQIWLDAIKLMKLIRDETRSAAESNDDESIAQALMKLKFAIILWCLFYSLNFYKCYTKINFHMLQIIVVYKFKIELVFCDLKQPSPFLGNFCDPNIHINIMNWQTGALEYRREDVLTLHDVSFYSWTWPRAGFLEPCAIIRLLKDFFGVKSTSEPNSVQ